MVLLCIVETTSPGKTFHAREHILIVLVLEKGMMNKSWLT